MIQASDCVSESLWKALQESALVLLVYRQCKWPLLVDSLDASELPENCSVSSVSIAKGALVR